MRSINELTREELLAFVSEFKDVYTLVLNSKNETSEYELDYLEQEFLRLETWWSFCKAKGIAPLKSIATTIQLPNNIIDMMVEKAKRDGVVFL